MKNIKEKINKWEELNKLLPKTVNRFRVYEIIEEIEKQSLSLQKQEIVKEILQIAENSVYNMASKNAIINYAKERNIQLNKNYLTNYEKYKRKNN